jgi:hypothetical protein
MKALLEFELPVDSEAHHDALHGSEWRMALVEISEYLRGEVKHGNYTAEEFAVFDKVREVIYKTLEDRGLNLYV